jgi:hypothetical protein
MVQIPTARGPQTVSCAVWWKQDGIWQMPQRCLRAVRLKCMHLYTETGTFAIGDSQNILRDGSDIGLNDLHELVEEVIL